MTPSRALKPLPRPPLLHVSVQESLKQFIADNTLKAGDPLPAESDLARSLGVGRNSVREAIKALESLGMLETRRGIGVFVRAFSLDALIDNLPYGLGRSLRDIEEIIEIRRTLETAMIGQAIERMPAQDLMELRGITLAMRRRAEQGESFADEDRAFHAVLFRGLDNRMLIRLIDVFWRAFDRAADFFNTDNPDPMQTWRDHDAIVEAVARKDVDEARLRLARHYHGISAVIANARAAEADRT
ncbi:FadR/GntR family transcriptional regulator [uncultured Alsobacter sp.]|uniref:FadR/GntR family transcriptional regulator n=1 Tax=uncultured Alsobacter sp. TaxID=1748258 RepID=UPI0025CF65BF|nr:FadR/GntR family transcriptional regulator [uncultured Alsobacter sp.]